MPLILIISTIVLITSFFIVCVTLFCFWLESKDFIRILPDWVLTILGYSVFAVIISFFVGTFAYSDFKEKVCNQTCGINEPWLKDDTCYCKIEGRWEIQKI